MLDMKPCIQAMNGIIRFYVGHPLSSDNGLISQKLL